MVEQNHESKKYPSLHSNPRHLVDYRIQKPVIHHPSENKESDDNEDKK